MIPLSFPLNLNQTETCETTNGLVFGRLTSCLGLLKASGVHLHYWADPWHRGILDLSDLCYISYSV